MSLQTQRGMQRARSLMRLVVFMAVGLGLQTLYLTIFKSRELTIHAMKPSERVELIPAPRGCIFDRDHRTLACNRLCYEVGVCYRDFMSYPAIRARWNLGRRERHYPRREQVQNLSHLLAMALGMDPQQVEDFIYSEAALSPGQIVILKRDVSEETFYRLRALESEQPGLRARMSLRRYYPNGAVAGQLLGYVGAVDGAERRLQLEKLSSLQAQLAMEEDPASLQLLQEQLNQAQERLQSLNQLTGKMGIESMQEMHLRGEDGKSWLKLNARGYTLQRAAQTDPIRGRDIQLCIDLELQQLAEKLLAQNENIRDEQLIFEAANCPQTWVKGGSVIVMDPYTGHVLAMASYPRFNPQTFMHVGSIEKEVNELIQSPDLSSKHFWLEDSTWTAGLWDGRWDFWREVYEKNTWSWQSHQGTWQYCLESICGPQSAVPSHFAKMKSITSVWQVANSFARIRESLGKDLDIWSLVNFLFSKRQDIPFWPSKETQGLENVEQRWAQVDPVLAIDMDRKILEQSLIDLPSNFDKMLSIELCGLLVDEKAFDCLPSATVQSITPEQYKEHTKAYLNLRMVIRDLLQTWHQRDVFSVWRANNQKIFLKEKRRLEQSQNIYAKPYLYYLEKERQAQFNDLWDRFGRQITCWMISESACDIEWEPALKSLRIELEKHPAKDRLKFDIERLRHLFTNMGSDVFDQYIANMRSFEQLQKPLWGTYPLFHRGRSCTRRELASLIYPRYGLGYMSQKAISMVGPPGSIFKLAIAYEVLFQRYQRGFSGWDNMSPFKIFDANYKSGREMIVGKWPSGKEIHQIHRGGRLPKSQKKYIGEIDLLGAIESSSNPYFSLLADLELNDAPQDVLRIGYELGWGHKTGIDLPYERTGALPFDLAINRTGLYTTAIGQHTLLGTPIQAAVMMSAFANGGLILRPKLVDDGLGPDIRGHIELPDRVREYLMEGMRRVVSGLHGSARSASLMSYGPGSPERKIINRMVPYIVGKTSTAEFVEVFGISPPKGSAKHSNIWFVGIVFDEPLYQGTPPTRASFTDKQPQLVIVVCLHLGRFGKEAFPIAAMLADRWKQNSSQETKKAI